MKSRKVDKNRVGHKHVVDSDRRGHDAHLHTKARWSG